MKSGPTHHELGTKVVITDDALQNIVNGNRSIHAIPSDSYVAKARELHRRRLVGEVTRQFLPGYEVNVTFSDGQTLQMKDHWFEVAGPDAKSFELPPSPVTQDTDAFAKSLGGTPIKKWDPKNYALGLRTSREITIENYRELGKVVVPKGTRVTADTARGGTDGSWFFVSDLRFLPESLAKHDATYYGIRVEAADVEPIVYPVPELTDSPSP